MRILLAKGDEFSRTFFGATLKRLGHDPVLVCDGQEAIETYRKNHFPLVISDWVMPGVDGLELCRLIRAEHPQAYCYIVLLTEREGRQSFLEGLRAGADDFIIKPFNDDVLAAQLMVGDRIVNIRNLNRAFAQLIPICSYCKKARTDNDYWQSLDEFLLGQPGLNLSHGICPSCQKNTVRPQLDQIKQKREATRLLASRQSNRM